jgi:hypothetical protein
MNLRLALIGAALAAGMVAGSAAAATVTVLGTSNPWDPSIAGNNLFGQTSDLTLPLLPGATGAVSLAVNAGDNLSFLYLSGHTSAFFGAPPTVDANGYVEDIFGSGASFGDPPIVLTGVGSTGNPLPSFYADPSNTGPDVWLNELLGDFVDGSGVVIGDAFAIGNGPFSIIAPTGAVRLQLGLNDDIFSDNSGSLSIQVDGSTAPGGVPEPATWALMLGGFGLAGAALRRRRQAAAA